MNPTLSVVVCTHNPRLDYLRQVLDALKLQTLPVQDWELLLIDNASDQILAEKVDLSWHPCARHIREDQLGLTPARLRGIQESIAPILVFVDDDNVLDVNYLELVLATGHSFPHLGAWGGQVQANFEVTPPSWAEPYLGFLAIRSFERDQWSNLLHQYETTPCGAGLCVRKIIAEAYADLVRCDAKRLNLDRKGTLLMSGGDTDLAFTACDLGLGTGVFTALRLTHLIPQSRLTEEYLLRLMEGMTYSHILLDSFRGKQAIPSLPSWRERLYSIYHFWKMNPRERRFDRVIRRGKTLAIQALEQLEKESKDLPQAPVASKAHTFELPQEIHDPLQSQYD
jgi:glycosyltransferase involved in cell wall biosynthesis